MKWDVSELYRTVLDKLVVLTNSYDLSQGKRTKGKVLLPGKKKIQYSQILSVKMYLCVSTSVKTVISKTMIGQLVWSQSHWETNLSV